MDELDRELPNGMAEGAHQLRTANHEADEDADEEVRNLDLPGIFSLSTLIKINFLKLIFDYKNSPSGNRFAE